MLTVKELKAQLEKLNEDDVVSLNVWYREPNDWKCKRVDIYDIEAINTAMGPIITTINPNPIKELDFKNWGE